MKKSYVALLFLFSTFLAPPYVAAQIIDIDKDYTNDIYGNASDKNNPSDHSLDSNDNIVNFSKDSLTFTDITVYGSYGDQGKNVSRNTVNITAKSLNGIVAIFGGYSNNTSASSHETSYNTVNIAEGTNNTYKSIYGGYGGDTASNNKVDMKSGSVTYVIAGGVADSDLGIGIADSNSVVLNGVIGRAIVGGGGLIVTNNTVDITDGSFINAPISGGASSVSSPNNVVMQAVNNKVSIKGNGTFDFSFIYGGASWLGLVKDNKIYIDGGVFTQSDFFAGITREGSATNNSVEITGGDFDGAHIAGGYAMATTPAKYAEFEASNNTVKLTGGKFINNANGYIYGGVAVVYAPDVVSVAVENNTVNISGGTFEGTVVGGCLYSDDAFSSLTKASVSNNTINISGNPNLTKASLFGSYSNLAGTSVSGNTLNLSTNITVLRARAFNNYNFFVDGVKATPMLKATASAVDMNNSVVGLYLKDASVQLNVGDELFLVENMSGNVISKSDVMKAGATMLYNYDLSVKDNNLYAVIGRNSSGDGGADDLNPETKSLSESRISSIGVLINGADLVADGAISSADATLQDNNNGVFSAINFNSVKLSSGSHVDVSNAAFMLGVGSKISNSLVGVFLESGFGSHNTYNEFDKSTVKGSGDNSYIGTGLLGRVSFENIYLEASARGGNIYTSYKADYSDGAKYDINSLYYGGHLSAGLVQNIADFSLNEYVKYLYTIQNGGSVSLDSKEEVQFADVISSRAMVGIRAKYFGGFIGYAYEEELAGKAKAMTSDKSIDAPIIKGGTNVIEAGYDHSFAKKSQGFNIGAGVKGYIGQRTGFSANARMGYMF
ncbi:MAG: hypothetical protein LBQ34_05800 [Alphaproteobacteria bacterium]|jgi:hypothetical protein|nr:hypothetical protein [Alphaproteobacteria bacterium]